MYSNPEHIPFLQDEALKESELIYDGAILQLYRNQIELENGQLAYRELINHQSAVGILAITPRDTAILVKQYRPAVVDHIIEIPAGLRDFIEGREEDALLAAKRELEEETGYQANDWTELGSYYVSPGFINEKVTVFVAEGLIKVENPLAQDEDEQIELVEYTRQEVKTMLDNDKVRDMKTALALNYWLYQKGE